MGRVSSYATKGTRNSCGRRSDRSSSGFFPLQEGWEAAWVTRAIASVPRVHARSKRRDPIRKAQESGSVSRAALTCFTSHVARVFSQGFSPEIAERIWRV